MAEMKKGIGKIAVYQVYRCQNCCAPLAGFEEGNPIWMSDDATVDETGVWHKCNRRKNVVLMKNHVWLPDFMRGVEMGERNKVNSKPPKINHNAQ